MPLAKIGRCFETYLRKKIMSQWVEITFDCLPLRSVGRLDIPIDASPKYRQRCESIKQALEKHGSHNSYYLYNAQCIYHLVNHPEQGAVHFKVEGTVLTDDGDCTTKLCDLHVELVRETCDWLSEPIVEWFAETVTQSIRVEFDRYIEAGDLAAAQKRIEKLQAESEAAGGFLGMYL
jgi:hypothetical protein